MIAFKNFTKRFKGNTEDVLDIPHVQLENKIYWLKGQNGIGKTSLLKSIAGLIPFEGNVIVDELDLSRNRTAYRLNINYAEAEPVYPEFIKATDLINLYSYTKKATGDQLTYLIKIFGISSYIDNKVGSYSSGMTKKLSLLLAFIGSPKLILLDEPFITLDPQAVIIVENLIAEYHKNGTAFIIASHQDFSLKLQNAVSIVLKNKTIYYHNNDQCS